MSALFAGLTTVDVLHGLDHTPDPTLKTTSTDFLLAAGGPATNAAVAYATVAQWAARHHTQTPASGPLLLTALGSGALAHLLNEDLTTAGVHILDATHTDTGTPADSGVPTSFPAISSIVDHPTGRMVASTNARVATDVEQAANHLEAHGSWEVVMVDGHNPELAQLALTRHVTPTPDDADLMADFIARENYAGPPRILDGGSWKPWLTPLLHHIDIAVISADFAPPLCAQMDRDTPEFELAVVDFLRGFGITKIVRTRGPQPIHWWWDGASGEVSVPHVEATSTLGAGDIFHGAFTWALKHSPTPADPTAIIDFAARVAALSTTHFGTRTWREDPALGSLVVTFFGTDTHKGAARA